MSNGWGYLLGTGSREPSAELIEQVPLQCEALFGHAVAHGVRRFIVVHGGARGIDYELVRWSRIPHRPYSVGDKKVVPDWEAPCRPDRCNEGHRMRRGDGTYYCPAAGIYRNEAMVDFVMEKYREGAWVCVAAFFQDPASKGTRNCADYAMRQGLSVLEFGNGPQRRDRPEVPRVRPSGEDQLRQDGP